MKKYFILLVLILFPFNVAAKCDDAEKVRLNKLAQNVSFTYDYVEANNDISFNVTITNLNKSLKIYDKYNQTEYRYSGANELTIRNYSAGTTARYYIYAADDTCIDSPIGNYAITFPDYNPYYKDSLCQQAKNYVYCNRWIKMPYEYNEFKNKVSSYIKQNTKVEEEVVVIEEETSVWDVLIDIYVNFYYIILPIIIVSCLISIYHLNKKNKII